MGNTFNPEDPAQREAANRKNREDTLNRFQKDASAAKTSPPSSATSASKPPEGGLWNKLQDFMSKGGQDQQQRQTAALKELADKFGKPDSTCNASRPELLAISNAVTAPHPSPGIKAAAENCSVNMEALGYPTGKP